MGSARPAGLLAAFSRGRMRRFRTVVSVLAQSPSLD
jgi:hypothetical protein